MAKLKIKTLGDLLELFEQVGKQLVIDLPKTGSLLDDQLTVTKNDSLLDAIVFGPKSSPDEA